MGNWNSEIEGVVLKILYSDDEIFDGKDASIFLAGPSPRKSDVQSWRPKAIEILKEAGFEGTILVPERKDWSVQFDYIDQVKWEQAGLKLASIIVFWVPRNMETMLGLTTNVEFGYWVSKSPKRVVYGRPHGAANTRYLDWLICEETNDCVNIHDDLLPLLVEAISLTPDPDDESL